MYGLCDLAGGLLYVGMSFRLRRRLATYFGGGEATRKELRLGARTFAVLWESIDHPLITPLRELELIQTLRPPKNVRGRRALRRTSMLQLTDGDRPWFELAEPAPLHGGSSASCRWGPLAPGRQTRTAVVALNRLFGLADRGRSAPTVETVRYDMFLPRIELPGRPAARLATADGYRERVAAAIEFVTGSDASPLTRLQELMQTAAAERRFELAARLRDERAALDGLRRQLQGARAPADESAQLAPVALGRSAWWCLINRGEAYGLWRAPATADAASRLRDELLQLAAARDVAARPRDLENVTIVRRWRRELEAGQRDGAIRSSPLACQNVSRETSASTELPKCFT